jgi:hypothetical protein
MKKAAILLSTALCCLGTWSPDISMAQLSAIPEGAVRSLKRVTVVSTDEGNRRISFLHEPTDFQIDAKLAEKPDLKRLRRLDPDGIPDGSFARFWGNIDPQSKIIHGAARIFAQPDSQPPYVPGQTTIAGRLYRERLTKPEPKNGWTTFDGSSAFVLETSDSVRWKLVTSGRPATVVVEPGSFPDFQKGRTADVGLKRVHGQWELTRADIDVWPPGAELVSGLGHYRGGEASGVSASQYQAKLDPLLAKLSAMTSELDKLMPVTLTITPELVLPGEAVTLQIRALAEKSPNAKATIYPDYFHAGMKEGHEIRLDWKEAGTQGGQKVYIASVPLPSAKIGQYFVEWTSDIGGDIDKYSRSYAVCDKGSAVCLFQITNAIHPPAESDFHDLHIPLDYWAEVIKLDSWEKVTASRVAEASRRYRQYGDNPGFCLEHFAWGTAQVRNEPLDLQELQIHALKKLVPLFGFDGSDIACWSYTMGNDSYRMLQKEGGFTVTSLCNENSIDGDMEINHWGKPERPYFISNEDFRKAGPGGKRGTLAFSQVQRHTYLSRHYFCDFNIEPGNGATPVVGGGGRKDYDEIFFSRLLDFYDALLQMPRCQSGPFFIAEGIEFNGKMPGATEGNRLIVNYASNKAKEGNVVFSTVRGVSDFYKRHYSETPESVCYFQDYWAGIIDKEKPIALVDSMSIENAELYSLALYGQLIPEDQYDYAVKWDFQDVGNESIPRRIGDVSCYIIPGKHDKYAVTPKIVDTRVFHASREDSVDGSAMLIKVKVEAKERRQALALSLWDIPREFKKGSSWFKASEGARFVPVMAPYTDNLNGFLIVDVKPGSNTFTLRIDSPSHKLGSLDFAIGESLKGKVYARDGIMMAYVWNKSPWESSLALTLPRGKSAKVYVAPDGVTKECAAGENVFKIPQGQWLRIVGLTREELSAFSKQQ